MRTPALLAFIAIALPATGQAETLNVQCRYIGTRTGEMPESVRSVTIDTTAPSITLSGSAIDATGSAARWVFRNDRQLGDVLTIHAQGDHIAGAAIRLVAHGFALDRKTGGFVWSYVEEKGPTAYRFTCR